MSLRPRYSLLTMLLLTAAVAGGIKLWRGPHELTVMDHLFSAELPQTPTPAEEAMLALMPVRPYVCGGSILKHRYVYKNSLAGRELILVAGAPTDTHNLIVRSTGSFVEHFWLTRHYEDRTPTAEGSGFDEELHGWVQGEPDKIPHDNRWTSMMHGNLQVTVAYQKYDRERSRLYLLTKKKQVFQVEYRRILNVTLLPIEVEAIPNADVREWIYEEFAKL